MASKSSDFPTRGAICTVAAAVVAAAGAAALEPDQMGPILAFAGVLIVAFVTWISADRRQGLALGAERERQAAALAHARELADLSDVRAVLDAASGDLYQASYVRREVQDAFLSHGLHVVDRANDSMVKFAGALRELDALHARLVVRLGRDHGATKAFVAATDELRALAVALSMAHGDDTPLPERGPLRTQIRAAGKDFDEHRRLFEDVATAVAGSRLTAG